MGLLDRISLAGLLRFVRNRTIEGVIILAILYFFPNIPPFCKISTPYKVVETLPLEGKLALNDKLGEAEFWHLNNIHGAESFASFNGELYTGLQSGEIVKLTGDKHISPITSFGKACKFFEEAKCGRTLGLTFDENGSLYAADAYHGIFKVNVQTGEKTRLVSPDVEINGVKPRFFNSIAVSKTGELYWTESSTELTLDDGVFATLADGSGRLLKHDPITKRNTVLIDKLHFANGLMLTEAEDALIVVETCRNLLYKYHLKGDKAGQYEVLIEGLPGTPDNVKPDGHGGFLVSLPTSHDASIPSIFQIFGPFPWIRKLIARSFGMLQLTFKAIDYVYPNDYVKIGVHLVGHFSLPLNYLHLNPRTTIIRITEDGEILDSFHTINGKLFAISESFIFQDYLLLGSPVNKYIGRIPLKDLGLPKPAPKATSEKPKPSEAPVTKPSQTETTTEAPMPKPAPQPTQAPVVASTPKPSPEPTKAEPQTTMKPSQSSQEQKPKQEAATSAPKQQTQPSNNKQDTPSPKPTSSKHEL